MKKSSCENWLYDLIDDVGISTVKRGEGSEISPYWQLVS